MSRCEEFENSKIQSLKKKKFFEPEFSNLK